MVQGPKVSSLGKTVPYLQTPQESMVRVEISCRNANALRYHTTPLLNCLGVWTLVVLFFGCIMHQWNQFSLLTIALAPCHMPKTNDFWPKNYIQYLSKKMNFQRIYGVFALDNITIWRLLIEKNFVLFLQKCNFQTWSAKKSILIFNSCSKKLANFSR